MKLRIFTRLLCCMLGIYLPAQAQSDPRSTRQIVIDIDTTLTTCCAEIDENFIGTFTTITALQSILQSGVCATQSITQANVGTTGFVITTSGAYKLTQNIIFNPAISAAAITIATDNVLLDLQCFSITQGNSTANVDGISIAANSSNVKIQNGKLQSFTRDGVRVASGCTNISYLNTTVQRCLYGIFCLGTLVSPIVEMQAEGLDLLSNSTGISLTFVNRALIEECSFFGNAHAGVELINSFSNSIDSCSIENTEAATGSAFGVSLTNGGNNKVNNCYIDGVSTSDIFSGNSAVGILIGTTEKDDIITNNQISNCTTISNAQPFGIEMLYTFTGIGQLSQVVYPGSEVPQNIQWSPNGRYLAVSLQTNLIIYEYLNGMIQQTASFGIVSSALAWSPDGSYLAEVGNNFVVYLVDQGLAKAVATISSGAAAVAWSSDGKYLATGDDAGNVIIYAFTNNVLIQLAQINLGFEIAFLEWAPEGSYIAVNSALTSLVTSVVKFSGNLLQLITSVSALIGVPPSWSPDGKYLAVVTNSTTISVYSFSGTALTLVASIATPAITQSSFWSPDGQYLAVVLGPTPFALAFLKFNGTSLTLQFEQTVAAGSGGFYQGFGWSPLGSVMSFGTDGSSGIPTLQVFSGFQFPSGSIIQNNELSNVRGPALPASQLGVSSGRGLSASCATNLIIENTAFNDDLNYVFVNNIFEQFLSNASQTPSLIANLSFPPL